MTQPFRTMLTVGLALWAAGPQVRAAGPDDLFDDRGALQDIRITMSARDWGTLRDRYQFDTYYAADVTWRDETRRNVGIRSRGNTTRSGIKPGLRIDFNRYLSDQEFLGLKAIVLDNTYDDVSLVREAVTMKMFAKLGLAAPRESHARVWVNNEYVGAYVLVEAFDRPFIARTFGAAEAEIERGGYLFEYNWVRPYGFEYLGPNLAAYAEVFVPKTRETDSMTALYRPFQQMIRAINESADDRLAADLAPYLDLPQFMRYLAIENFMADEDGLVGQDALHNFYLYRFRDQRPAQFLPWDKDRAFSSDTHPIDYHLDANVLTKRAMAIPEIGAIYYETLLACAALAEEPDADDPRGWLEREVQREINRLEPAVVEDRNYPFPIEAFYGEGERLRQFATTRPAFVRCETARVTGAAGGDQSCSPTR